MGVRMAFTPKLYGAQTRAVVGTLIIASTWISIITLLFNRCIDTAGEWITRIGCAGVVVIARVLCAQALCFIQSALADVIVSAGIIVVTGLLE